MRRPGRGRRWAWCRAGAPWVALVCLWAGPAALGQGPPDTRPGTLLEFPALGSAPGAMEGAFGRTPGAIQGDVTAPDNSIIGGRKASGRIPRKKGKGAPSPSITGPSAMAVSTPLAMRETTARSAGLQLPAALPEEVEDEGAPTGMSLDEAVERLMRQNLDLLALRYELTQADADIITAGLRANPLIYGDAQFIPYQPFSTNRPYGPSQYDFSITYPMDVSHKRKARVRVAEAARCTLEAQFQDVVRRQIGNLYRAYVDLQAARLTYLTARSSVEAQDRLIADARRTADQRKPGDTLDRLELQLEKTRGALEEAEGNLEDAREAVAVLLCMSPEESDSIEPRGRLRVVAPSPPSLESLIQLGLENRPDLIAARRGIGRADAEYTLARASRFDDWFLFYDPISYQDNSPSKLISAKSWDIGLTIPLPIYNRNQGGIARARANMTQTQIELAALERRLVSEIRLAYREYRNSRNALERLERTVLPEARRSRAEAETDFAAGRISADDYFGHLDDDSDTARSYREAIVRHRRSMLDLNTVLGVRLLP